MSPSTSGSSKDWEGLKLTLAAEVLRQNLTVHLRAWGTSMLPALWPGDLLTIQSVTDDQLRPGDIVLVLDNGRFLIHRLIEKQHDQGLSHLITRGDAMPQNDPPANISDFLGRVVRIRRGNQSFVPSRRVSRINSVRAWLLCHSNRFRSLSLRFHAARLHKDLMQPRQLLHSTFSTMHEIPYISSSRASHL
jgi:signal peptidase I